MILGALGLAGGAFGKLTRATVEYNGRITLIE